MDVEYAYGKVHVVRVPAYSPYAVAEHAMALLLTSIRRIHKAYIKTKDFNFSLEGMTGFDLHGKTVELSVQVRSAVSLLISAVALE